MSLAGVRGVPPPTVQPASPGPPPLPLLGTRTPRPLSTVKLPLAPTFACSPSHPFAPVQEIFADQHAELRVWDRCTVVAYFPPDVSLGVGSPGLAWGDDCG